MLLDVYVKPSQKSGRNMPVRFSYRGMKNNFAVDKLSLMVFVNQVVVFMTLTGFFANSTLDALNDKQGIRRGMQCFNQRILIFYDE